MAKEPILPKVADSYHYAHLQLCTSVITPAHYYANQLSNLPLQADLFNQICFNNY